MSERLPRESHKVQAKQPSVGIKWPDHFPENAGICRRMRHIVTGEALRTQRPAIALCGYALPMIEGFDEAGDWRSGTADVDCVVCAELSRGRR